MDRSPIVSTVANTAKPPEKILVNEWKIYVWVSDSFNKISPILWMNIYDLFNLI